MAKLPKIHKEALDRFEIIESAEKDERKESIEDIRFAQTKDGQWDDIAKTARTGRPRYTLNQIAAAIDTIIGDQRQNEISPSVLALTDDAKEAETYEGIIRNIEAQSSARNIYDSAFDEALNGGYGGWRVITRHNENDIFTQDICLEPIRSATTSLWFDQDAKQYDKRDAKFAFLTWDMSIEAFKNKYPKATVNDFNQKKYLQDTCRTWFKGETIRLAEYWRKIPIRREMGLLNDGRVIDLKEEAAVLDELAAIGIKVVKTRTVGAHKVQRFIMNGAEILEGPEEWAGKYIPLIPLFGKINYIEGKTYVRGLVRFAKDAQRIYNYIRSFIVETTALTPKDPYWITAEQAKGHTDKLARMAIDNPPFQLYNPDPDAPGAPSRTGAPQIQQAMIEQAQTASLDITKTLGVSAGTAQPMAGTDLDMRSGKAIEAQARRGDSGAFVFSDNLVKSIEYSSVVLVDLIPRIYDTARVIRIIQPNGEVEVKPINQVQVDQQTGAEVIVNDLTAGKYDVTASSGPMFATQREKAAETLQNLAVNNPVFAEVTPDLIAKSLDTPMSDELHARIRKQMIVAGIAEPTDEEAQEMNVEQMKQNQLIQQLTQQIAAQLQQDGNIRLLNSEAAKREAEVNRMLQDQKIDAFQAAADVDNTIADTDKKRADTDKSKVDANKTTNDAMGVMLDNIAKMMQSGIPIDQAVRELKITQEDLIFISQQAISPGPNSEQMQLAQASLIQALQQGIF